MQKAFPRRMGGDTFQVDQRRNSSLSSSAERVLVTTRPARRWRGDPWRVGPSGDARSRPQGMRASVCQTRRWSSRFNARNDCGWPDRGLIDVIIEVILLFPKKSILPGTGGTAYGRSPRTKGRNLRTATRKGRGSLAREISQYEYEYEVVGSPGRWLLECRQHCGQLPDQLDHGDRQVGGGTGERKGERSRLGQPGEWEGRLGVSSVCRSVLRSWAARRWADWSGGGPECGDKASLRRRPRF